MSISKTGINFGMHLRSYHQVVSINNAESKTNMRSCYYAKDQPES